MDSYAFPSSRHRIRCSSCQIHRDKILAMVSRVRTAESSQELLATQREVDHR